MPLPDLVWVDGSAGEKVEMQAWPTAVGQQMALRQCRVV